MLLAACSRLGAGDGRLAVDLGCGEGTDALALLERGWSVLAIDVESAGLAALRARVPAAHAGRIRVVCAFFADAALPPAQLIHAGYSLPFCPPRQFPAVWTHIRRALVPGAIFAGQLFGVRDSWAGDPDMTFQTRAEVISLLDGLEILDLDETESDGEAYSGPKHWHTYDVLAREPGRASAGASRPLCAELPTSHVLRGQHRCGRRPSRSALQSPRPRTQDLVRCHHFGGLRASGQCRPFA